MVKKYFNVFAFSFAILFFVFLFAILLISNVSAALSVALSDQGTEVRTKSTGALLASGNLEVTVWDSLTDGNLIYNETFTNAISNGTWNVMIGENGSALLNLEFGKVYYRDYKINGEDVDFTLYNLSTIERRIFYSPLGDIAGEDLNQTANFTIASLNATATSYFRDVDFNSGWAAGGISILGGKIYADTGYFYNLSKLNVTSLNVNGSIIPQAGFDNNFDLGAPTLRWRDLWLSRNANVSDTLTTKSIIAYDWTNISHSLLYNHTLSTFSTYNSTWDNRYLISDLSGALSNNITSINKTKNIQELLNSTGVYSIPLTINSTKNIQELLNSTGIYGQATGFAKNTTAEIQQLLAGTNISQYAFNQVSGYMLNTSAETINSLIGTNISQYAFNQTLQTFNTFNSTWDNRYLIADLSTALSNNITSVNKTANIQALLNGTSLWLDSFNVTGTSYLGRLIISADNLSANNFMSANSTPTFSGNITFRNYSNEFMRITGEGKVGIGTSTPTALLNVVGDTNLSGNMNISGNLTFPNGGVGGPNTVAKAGIWFVNSTGQAGLSIFKASGNTLHFDPQDGGNIYNNLRGGTFVVYNATTSTTFFQVSPSGNVGIGTASPTGKLTINGSDDSSYGQLTVNSTGSDARIEFYNSAGPTTSGRGGIIMSKSAGYEGLRFLINNADKMIIDESGNVGIGTASPTSSLHVRSTTDDIIGIMDTDTNFTAGTYAWSYIEWNDVDNNRDWIMGRTATVGDFVVWNINDSIKFRLKRGIDGDIIFNEGDGKVGIGTTGPNEKLEVSGGNIKISGLTNPRFYMNSTAAGVSPRVMDVSGSDWRFYREAGPEGTLMFMTINTNGNVNIGTDATPDSLLDVDGALTVASCTGCSVIAEMQPITGSFDNGNAICIDTKTGNNIVCSKFNDLTVKGIATDKAEQILRLSCSNPERQLRIGGDIGETWKNDSYCQGWYPIAFGGLSEETKVLCHRNDGTSLQYGDRLVSSKEKGYLIPLTENEQGGDGVVGKAQTICKKGKEKDIIQVWLTI